MDPQSTPQKPADDRQEFHPDMTISPRDPQAAPAPPAPLNEAVPVAAASPPPPAGDDEQSFFRAEPDAAESGQPFQDDYAPRSPQPTGDAITWTASEFIAHEKNQFWYVVLTGAGLVIAGVVYLISREIFATVVAALVVILFGFGAARQPRQMQYGVDDHGLTVGNRKLPYGYFRSYSISEEDHFHSINFMPLKRFMPDISIYYDPQDEQRITEVLAAHLPAEVHKHDPVEKLMRRIRF